MKWIKEQEGTDREALVAERSNRKALIWRDDRGVAPSYILTLEEDGEMCEEQPSGSMAAAKSTGKAWLEG